ncbi:primosomal protein N' [soil metagenome]
MRRKYSSLQEIPSEVRRKYASLLHLGFCIFHLMPEKFVNIALNVPLDSTFTYKVPDYYFTEVVPGKRVLVDFGKRQVTGVIIEVLNKYEGIHTPKYIKSILDAESIIKPELMEFARWISSYYLAPIGEVIFSAIPRKINYSLEKFYKLTEKHIEKLDSSDLQNEVYNEIISAINSKKKTGITKKQLEKKLNIKNAADYISKLEELEIIETESSYTKTTKAKLVKFAKPLYAPSDISKVIAENRIKGVSQIQFLNRLSTDPDLELSELMKLTGISSSSLASLESKDLIEVYEVRKIREPEQIFKEENKTVILNDEQNVCLKRINEAIDKEEFHPFLIHGVTGSGKTEIYITAIEKVLAKGKSAIVLVPEISLTPQLIHRFKVRFGDKVGVIHSKLSDGEKLDTFDKIINSSYRIIVGARSAIFAPLKNIGIIVVDEEHDSSYKQESLPKYNGKDAAIVRAKINNAVVILGSATPSIESYYNAVNGKNELLVLKKRASTIKLPVIKVIDLTRRKKEQEEDYISSGSKYIKDDFVDILEKTRVKFLSVELLIEIGERLDKKESIIILQNRRGYHAYIECLNCHNVEMCERCSISLTFHKYGSYLKCHFCGFTKNNLIKCSTCGSPRLIQMGAGTEKVEEELLKIFSKARIVRMDSDTLTSKNSYQKILNDFYNKDIDILVGTQLISKGLDFPDVTLVGVVNADIGLLNPDFRATERTFQILTQVSGRSGRSEKPGEVIIQTNHPDYYVFENVINHDYEGFYEREIRGREAAFYPPFSRLCVIEIRSKDQRLAESKVKELFNLVTQLDKNKTMDVLPPNPPLFSKLKDQYRYHLLIKSIKSKDRTGKVLNSILNTAKKYIKDEMTSNVTGTIDVDAVNLL